jgi:ribosomal protein S18 acetylase RimI-like enzyme
MAECVREATHRGADALWLAVWQQATRPIAFYRKAGFEVMGTATFAMCSHFDADFIMVRTLSERPGR